jgi:tetratricopeptide (TPR) repeat protein
MRSARFASLLVGGIIVVALGCGDNAKTQQYLIPQPEDLSLVPETRVVMAVEAVQAEVAKAPQFATAWARLGHIYFIHAWETEAVVCYRRATELAPDDYRWFYYLGRSLSKVDPAAAVDALKRSIALNANYAPAHLYCAYGQRHLGRLDEAKQHFKRVADLAPQNPFAQLRLGELALSAGKFQTARDHLQRALTLNPEQSEVHAALAQLYLMLDNQVEAQRHAQAARRPTKYEPMDDPLWAQVQMAGMTRKWFAYRGRQFLEAQDYERAVTELAVAVSGEQKDPKVWYNYGAALVGAKWHEEAIAALKRALTENDGNHKTDEIASEELQAIIYNELGMAYAQRGNLELAEQYIQKALSHNPALFEAINNLVVLYRHQGQLADAVHFLQRTQEIHAVPKISRLLDELLREVGQ